MNLAHRFVGLCLGMATGAALGFLTYVACSILTYGLGWFSRSQVEIAVTVGPIAGAVLGVALSQVRLSPLHGAICASLLTALAHAAYLLVVLGGSTSNDPFKMQLYFLKGVILSAVAGALVGWYFEPGFARLIAISSKHTSARWKPALQPPP
jgi:hypothetical protein